MKKAFLNLFTAEGRRHEVPTSKGTWSSKPSYGYAIGADPQVSFCNRLHSKKQIPIFLESYQCVVDPIRHEGLCP